MNSENVRKRSLIKNWSKNNVPFTYKCKTFDKPPKPSTYYEFLECECNTDIFCHSKYSGEACPNGNVTNVPLSSDKTPPTWRLCRPHRPLPFLNRLLFSASRFEGDSFVTAVVLATSLPGVVSWVLHWCQGVPGS